MTTGAVIFAQNNSVIDYTKLACFAAERVQKFLNVPVSVITDAPSLVNSSIFDNVIKISNEEATHRRFF